MSIIYGPEQYTWAFNNNYIKAKKDFNLAISPENFELYNNLKNTKSKRIYFSDFISFENAQTVELTYNTFKNYNLEFSSENSFSNLMIKNSNVSTSKIHFSQGLFPYYENINLLLEPSTYADFVNVLNNPSVQGYIFDNSVPSREVILQTKVISWGIKDNNIQFSLRFPSYITNFEYNIDQIEKDYNINTEFKHFPKTPDTHNLNFGLDTVFGRDTLNWEWSPGKELKVSTDFEFSKTPDTIYLMNYQYAYMNIEDRKLNLEYKSTKIDKDSIDLEINLDEVSKYYKTNYEFFYGLEDTKSLDFETTSEFSGHLNYQTLVFAPSKMEMNFEFVPSSEDSETINYEYKNVYIQEYETNFETYIEIEKDYGLEAEFFIDAVDRKLNFEYKNIYIDEYILDLELNVDVIHKLYNLDVEYNAETIWKDYIINFEYKNIYDDVYNINIEQNVLNINKKEPLNLETLTFANTDKNLNFEVLRFQEKTVNMQTYTIPITYKDHIIQINISAFSKEDLNFEMNIPELPGNIPINFESKTRINKDYNLNLETNIPELWKIYKSELEVNIQNINSKRNFNLEYKSVFIDSDRINFESKTVINSKTNINFESYTEIEKNYKLAFQYLAKLPYDTGINFESKTVIKTDIQLQLEYNISALKKDYGINLESYVEIEKDYMFNFEAFVDEVSKYLHFEFDVLDLVYYVISKGYNILPWCYSDGTGFWDINSNKNWNKTEDMTTIQTGLLNQLEEKGLTIPELIQYSDKNLNSFGIFIPGKSKDINIQNDILYFESGQDFTLVLGKRKKEDTEIIQLRKGNNLVIYDGAYSANLIPTFDIIREQIIDNYNYCSIWQQELGEWSTLYGDKNDELYFVKIIDSQEQPIPKVLMINVKEDCSFVINR